MKTLQLTFPGSIEPAGVVAGVRALTGAARPGWRPGGRRGPVCVETWSIGGAISHLVTVPAASSAVAALSAALPGVRIEDDHERPLDRFRDLAASGLAVRGPSFGTVRTDIAPDLGTALLARLATIATTEVVVVHWLIVPLQRSRWSGGAHAEERLDRVKRAETETLAVGRIAAWAATRRRARSLTGSIGRVLRQAAGPDGYLTVRSMPGVVRRLIGIRWPMFVWPSHLNIAELAVMVAWPTGPTPIPGLTRGATRLLPPTRALPSNGPSVGVSTYPGPSRPIRLGTTGRLRHAHVIGPTGVGKTTLLTHLIEHDIAAGRGVVVFDPIGDLIESVAERIPKRRSHDVVVVDPTQTRRPVGLNILAGSNRRQLVEFTVGVFARLFASSWGPRTSDVLRACLLTISSSPGSTLADVPDLLTNPAIRHRFVPAVMHDRVLAGFWAWYEDLSAAERAAVIAPVLNKLRAVLLRPEAVQTLCHPDGDLDLAHVFTKRRIVLIRLAKGLIGQETASLIGGLLLARLWQTTLARTAIPAEQRHPVFLYLDEFQDYLRLPVGVGDMLSQARGLGVGLIVAHQHLGQLPETVRRDVLANVGSRVIFQTGVDDARILSRELEPHLTPADLRGLGRREIVASVALPDMRLLPVTGRTIAPSEPVTTAAAVRGRSVELFGRPLPAPRTVDDAATQVGRRRRGDGS